MSGSREAERVDLKLGFACNNRCVFCVQGNKREEYGPRPMKQVRADLAEGLQRGAVELVVTGGEPTLHDNLLEVVRLARELGYRNIQIQTNGRRFHYPAFCRAVIDAGATEFAPALHGSDASIHDEMTRAPGSFAQCKKGIENMVALGVPVITNTVVCRQNYRDLPRLARLLVSLGVQQFQFAFVHIVGTASTNQNWIVPRKREVVPFVREALDVGIEAGVRCMTEAIPYCCDMEGYEAFVAEQIIPETIVYDADKVIHSYDRFRREEGKAKRDECRNCKWDAICEGPWREYPELFGWDEFVPVEAAGETA